MKGTVKEVIQRRLIQAGISTAVTIAAVYGVWVVGRHYEKGIRFGLADGRSGRFDLIGRILKFDRRG